VLELGLAQLPEGAVGPGPLVRADSGGATHVFLDHVAARGLCFSVGFDLTEPLGGEHELEPGGVRLEGAEGEVGEAGVLAATDAVLDDGVLAMQLLEPLDPPALLLAWTQRLLLSGELARCEPKRLRYRLLHVAGRLTRHARRLRLHLPRGWAWGEALLDAFARLRALPQAP
jgi:hypothetical protein